ncbi:protein IQ-DOMAIN 32 isoform X4 [Elaeis guineensis]|uniref:Protein IQ-DOMAIN 32 isoform X4 n=1 Tax=Elaeis guineensis var. tenera TaxID=51953 RepID=A0A6I9SD19_ELAGV|nr:protein IQ-DOMAIN 32 isoform X4 [Elaeis guineensis]
MGRSKRSCLKMIACNGGGDVNDDDDDISMAESKTSSDKRRWSFRKRSARHRVLSNSVVSEPVSVSYNKESIEVPTNNFDSPIYSSIPGKKPIDQKINETFPLPSAVVNSEVANPLATNENSTANDINLDESVVIVIQAATRGYLARRGLQKLKSVVKLQAAVRGHLVRRQAIGTLRCVQSIVKLQAFVRTRRKCQLVEMLAAQENKLQVHAKRSRLLEKENSCIKPNKTYSSTKILLSNGFARQLLEATPKKKPICIKCDTSKSDDSTWKWLERWMAVTSSDIGQQLEKKLNQGCQGQEENTELVDYEARKEVPTAVFMSSDAEFASEEIRVLANGKGVVTAKNSVGTEGKKLVQGLRKPFNPAFTAAQSTFEALTSCSSISNCSNSSYQDATAKSNLNSYCFQVDASKESKDISFTENSVSCNRRVQIAASECSTEISISSILDSPDRSETEGGEIVLEIGALEKGHYDVSGDADTDLNLIKMKSEGKKSFDSVVLQPQQLEESAGNLLNSAAADDVVQVGQRPAEPTTSDMLTQLGNSVDSHIRLSLEGTSKSRTTVTESHGTPSSKISVNVKKSKNNDNMPIQKQRSQLAGKSSPSNPNNDSGGRTEHLTRDSKNAKRRNSLGMAKPDHVDHEHRISSSNSLPSYMQATESARAKAYASISPKLSPDVHDNHMKKRHSLPIENGKEGSSPRMQRSTSQAQQNSKGNATHSPHNSAERRWQR